MEEGRGRRSGARPHDVVTPSRLASAGHEVARRGDGVWIEAWAPELAGCLVEALDGLVEATGAGPGEEDAPSYEAVPLSAGPAPPTELLMALFEEVLGAQQVLSLSPVRFHLAATEDGGVAGDMELARRRPSVHGTLAALVARDGLTVASSPTGWQCRVRLVT